VGEDRAALPANQPGPRRKDDRLILSGIMQVLKASDFAVHSTAGIIGEADSMLSRTRASLAPAQPVLCILDNIDPLAKTRRQEMNGKL
jgi:hypothetical protein